MFTSSNNSTYGLPLGPFGFDSLLEHIELICLDVGARGGFTKDLLPIAPAVRAIGFEPDVEECERLNERADGGSLPWKSLRFIPVALGRTTEERRLSIYRKRGCSSLLDADIELARRFMRDGYYELDGIMTVPTISADAAAHQYGFCDAAFFKLDVQGAELEILSGGQHLLATSLVALRIEVSFLPVYKQQPLFADIDEEMRRHDFFPMRFLELHSWRRSSKAKLPNLASGPYPYSQGQLVHGDVLYLRNSEGMADNDDAAIDRLLRAALLALSYGLIDHAMAIFERPLVKEAISDRFDFDAPAAVSAYSRQLARCNPPPISRRLRDRVKRLLGTAQ